MSRARVRQLPLSLICIVILNALLLLYLHSSPSTAPPPPLSISPADSCEVCVLDPSDPLCQYGIDNIRLSRAYEGSGYRVRKMLEKGLRGEEITIGVIGASVTQGHGLRGKPTYHDHLLEGLLELFPGQVKRFDGSSSGMNSEFYGYCFHTVLPNDLDMYIVELDINNEATDATYKADDTLFRLLLNLPQEPAVIRASVFALAFPDLARGLVSSLVMSEFFDVPVISIRNFLLPHLILHRDQTSIFFAADDNGGTDLRHISANSHKALGDMLTLYMREQTCEAQRRLSYPPHAHVGIWPGHDILGKVPAIFLWDTYTNPSVPPPVTPSCDFASSKTHPLLPIPSTTSDSWTIIEWNGKAAWQTSEVGAIISFPFVGTRVGLFVWSSNGVGHTITPGKMGCWIDGNVGRVVGVDAYKYDPIGSSLWAVVGQDLSHGDHIVTCKLLAESSTEGHDIRIQGVAAQ